MQVRLCRWLGYRSHPLFLFVQMALAALLIQQAEPVPHAIAAPPRREPATALPPTSTAGRQPTITVQTNFSEVAIESEAQFSPNGQLLAVNDQTRIKLWDLASGRPLRSFEHIAYFSKFTFLGDGGQIRQERRAIPSLLWGWALLRKELPTGFRRCEWSRSNPNRR